MMTDEPQKMLNISWDMFHRDCRELAQKIIEVGRFEKMVAITRGGLFPAGIIARELNIRHIDSISIASYDEYFQGELRLIKPPMIEGDGEGVLFVDELVDTGKTLEFIRKKYPKAHIATIYAKEKGVKFVDTYVSMVNCWVLFPWDGKFAPSKPLIDNK